MPAAVLGFRPHTYWTAAVAVIGDAGAPQVVHRRRIEFVEERLRFAYHRAEEAPDRAEAVIAKARAGQLAAATAEIARLVADLKTQGFNVSAAATAASTTRLPARLEDILASHARIHAAEGVFARDIIADACAAAGLRVVRVEERELHALVGDLIGGGPTTAKARLADMGGKLGPPWSEDYRLATLAAWLAL